MFIAEVFVIFKRIKIPIKMKIKTQNLFIVALLVFAEYTNAQYLSDVGLKNRMKGKYVYNVRSATDGFDGKNDTTFTKKWIISMYAYIVGNGYDLGVAQKTKLKEVLQIQMRFH